MKNSSVEYLIFNKETGEYITTYYNENTLKTLDLDRCYYTVQDNRQWKKQVTQAVKSKIESTRSYGKGSSSSYRNTNQTESSQDTSLLNPTNVLLYTTMMNDSSSDHNSCNNSSSSYSDSSSSSSDSSSSSCSSDSSSW